MYGKCVGSICCNNQLFATHSTLYLKAGGNAVYKSCQKSDTTTILGAFRIFEISGLNQSVQTEDISVQTEDIYVENSLGPQTESPWFLIPRMIFYISLKSIICVFC